MMHPFSHDPRYVEFHLHELRAKAAQAHLVHLARQGADRTRQDDRSRRWRQRTGALLIAIGEALVGPQAEATCPDRSGGLSRDSAWVREASPSCTTTPS